MRILGLICVAIALALAACSGTPTSPSVLGEQRDTATGFGRTPYKISYVFAGEPDGAGPFAGLTSLNGTFYGTTENGGSSPCTSGCGTIFQISRNGAEKVLHTFVGSPDGANPLAGLTKLNGVLYGVTQGGGSNDAGAIFSITPSGSEHVVYSFLGSPYDGQYPSGGLVAVNGKLYGTTEYGGGGFEGTVYEVTTSGTERVIYFFAGQPDGANPRGTLLNLHGTLYGTTEYGGTGTFCANYGEHGCGTVFKITTSGSYSILHSFIGTPGSDGSRPLAGLIDLGSGTLAGTTLAGGSSSRGTVFEITTSGSEHVLYSFTGQADGANPIAPLVELKGALYGTTSGGGLTGCEPSGNGCGTVFSMSLSGTETVLHAFSGSPDGNLPEGGLAPLNGVLYGTTFEGGGGYCASGCGTVYRVLP